jgi:hypothetical protein
MIDAAARLSHEHLSDFDWKIKVVVASSKSSGIRQPLLQLALYLTDADGRTREVLLELNKAELELILGTLSKLREGLQRIPQR